MIISEIQSEIGHCSCDSANFKAPVDFSHHAILFLTLSLKYIEIRKHFFKIYFPPVCQQKLLPVYVLPYFTHYMEVACGHKGGKVFSSPKTQGLSPLNAFSTE